MRTTITLEADAQAVVERLMNEESLTFKAAVNEAIRRGAPTVRQFETRTYSMGKPTTSLDKALAMATELEDEEIRRKAELGK